MARRCPLADLVARDAERSTDPFAESTAGYGGVDGPPPQDLAPGSYTPFVAPHSHSAFVSSLEESPSALSTIWNPGLITFWGITIIVTYLATDTVQHHAPTQSWRRVGADAAFAAILSYTSHVMATRCGRRLLVA